MMNILVWAKTLQWILCGSSYWMSILPEYGEFDMEQAELSKSANERRPREVRAAKLVQRGSGPKAQAS